MSSSPDYKYTDTRVRSNPHLRKQAEKFLASYKGDFEYLTRMQAVLSDYGSLTVPQARGVLNCMIHDGGTLGEEYFDEPAEEAPVLKVVEKDRPYVIYLKATFPREFLWSSHIQGRKIHLVDSDRSELRYYPEDWRTKQPAYEALVFAKCGQRYRSTLQMGDVPPSDYDECVRCFSKESCG